MMLVLTRWLYTSPLVDLFEVSVPGECSAKQQRVRKSYIFLYMLPSLMRPLWFYAGISVEHSFETSKSAFSNTSNNRRLTFSHV